MQRLLTSDFGLLNLHGPQTPKVLRLLQITGIIPRLCSLLCCLPLLCLLHTNTTCPEMDSDCCKWDAFSRGSTGVSLIQENSSLLPRQGVK